METNQVIVDNPKVGFIARNSVKIILRPIIIIVVIFFCLLNLEVVYKDFYYFFILLGVFLLNLYFVIAQNSQYIRRIETDSDGVLIYFMNNAKNLKVKILWNEFHINYRIWVKESNEKEIAELTILKRDAKVIIQQSDDITRANPWDKQMVEDVYKKLLLAKTTRDSK